MNHVNYKISTYPSRFLGYQEKKQDTGNITLYISTIHEKSIDFDDFVELLLDTLVLERICLERAFQKIRMKNRCVDFVWVMNGSLKATGVFARIFHAITTMKYSCKMEFVASLMRFVEDLDEVDQHE